MFNGTSTENQPLISTGEKSCNLCSAESKAVTTTGLYSFPNTFFYEQTVENGLALLEWDNTILLYALRLIFLFLLIMTFKRYHPPTRDYFLDKNNSTQIESDLIEKDTADILLSIPKTIPAPPVWLLYPSTFLKLLATSAAILSLPSLVFKLLSEDTPPFWTTIIGMELALLTLIPSGLVHLAAFLKPGTILHPSFVGLEKGCFNADFIAASSALVNVITSITPMANLYLFSDNSALKIIAGTLAAYGLVLLPVPNYFESQKFYRNLTRNSEYTFTASDLWAKNTAFFKAMIAQPISFLLMLLKSELPPAATWSIFTLAVIPGSFAGFFPQHVLFSGGTTKHGKQIKVEIKDILNYLVCRSSVFSSPPLVDENNCDRLIEVIDDRIVANGVSNQNGLALSKQ